MSLDTAVMTICVLRHYPMINRAIEARIARSDGFPWWLCVRKASNFLIFWLFFDPFFW